MVRDQVSTLASVDVPHHCHEAHIHVELVVAVEQRQPWLGRRHVDLHLLPGGYDHHVLPDARDGLPRVFDQLEGVSMQVDRVTIGDSPW